MSQKCSSNDPVQTLLKRLYSALLNKKASRAKNTKKKTENVEIPRKPGFPAAARINNMDQGR